MVLTSRLSRTERLASLFWRSDFNPTYYHARLDRIIRLEDPKLLDERLRGPGEAHRLRALQYRLFGGRCMYIFHL